MKYGFNNGNLLYLLFMFICAQVSTRRMSYWRQHEVGMRRNSCLYLHLSMLTVMQVMVER